MTIKYAVQSFRQTGRGLVADLQQPSRSSEAAIATAERLLMTRAGVVVFSQEVDVETDCYDEPILLIRGGVLPAELTD